MKDFIRKIGLVLGSVLMPLTTFAALSDSITTLTTQLNAIPKLLIGVAVLYFLWGVLKYITAGGEGEVGEASQMIIWGLVAIFVMTAVVGLVGIVAGTFNVPSGGTLTPPSI